MAKRKIFVSVQENKEAENYLPAFFKFIFVMSKFWRNFPRNQLNWSKLHEKNTFFQNFPDLFLSKTTENSLPNKTLLPVQVDATWAQDGHGSCQCWNWELSSRGSLLQLQASFFPCLPFGLNRDRSCLDTFCSCPLQTWRPLMHTFWTCTSQTPF